MSAESRAADTSCVALSLMVADVSYHRRPRSHRLTRRKAEQRARGRKFDTPHLCIYP